MTFDPMAIAVDWLDAYRACDIDALLSMYAGDAVTECGCDRLTVTGEEGLRAFWQHRFENYPVSDLADLRANGAGATVSYVVCDRVVTAAMEFNAAGRISRLQCVSSR